MVFCGKGSSKFTTQVQGKTLGKGGQGCNFQAWRRRGLGEASLISMAEQLMKELADGTATFELMSQNQERPVARVFASMSVTLFGRRKESDPCFARIAPLRMGTPAFAKKLEHYTIHKVKGDGRCMFRALALGMAFNGGFNLSSNEERKQADDLRMTVMDALCSSEKERLKYEEALIAITLDESINR